MTISSTGSEPTQSESPEGESLRADSPEPKGSLVIPSRFVRVIDRSNDGILSRIREAFQWRDLLFMLVQRDIKVRYRQTAFGVIWAIMVPLLTLSVYWVVFDKLGRMGPDGMPYPLFLFPGMIVWHYFS